MQAVESFVSAVSQLIGRSGRVLLATFELIHHAVQPFAFTGQILGADPGFVQGSVHAVEFFGLLLEGRAGPVDLVLLGDQLILHRS
ncbi:hypothetical protein SDC9_164755 [bioreactor metagenome]|uniref:Uncharacterized protein n=1 Tax=bioreactor metagenome TaxID=1076179 RepID=A0A645FUS5_9ZZZZ